MKVVGYHAPAAPAVRRIAMDVMGAGYMPDPDGVAADRATRILIAVADDDQAVLGFCVFSYPQRGCLRERLRLPGPVTLPAAVGQGDANGAIAVVEILAVDPAFQGRGIGRRLFQATETAIAASRRRVVVVTAWRIGNTLPLGRILATSGYDRWAALDDYWRDACDGGAFCCPHRGDRCRCSLVVYQKAILARDARSDGR